MADLSFLYQLLYKRPITFKLHISSLVSFTCPWTFRQDLIWYSLLRYSFPLGTVYRVMAIIPDIHSGTLHELCTPFTPGTLEDVEISVVVFTWVNRKKSYRSSSHFDLFSPLWNTSNMFSVTFVCPDKSDCPSQAHVFPTSWHQVNMQAC